MLKLINTHWIGTHFACPILYGDLTGLHDTDEAALDAWVAQYPSATFNFTEETDEFRRCDITGLMGNCIKVEIYKDFEDLDQISLDIRVRATKDDPFAWVEVMRQGQMVRYDCVDRTEIQKTILEVLCNSES